MSDINLLKSILNKYNDILRKDDSVDPYGHVETKAMRDMTTKTHPDSDLFEHMGLPEKAAVTGLSGMTVATLTALMALGSAIITGQGFEGKMPKYSNRTQFSNSGTYSPPVEPLTNVMRERITRDGETELYYPDGKLTGRDTGEVGKEIGQAFLEGIDRLIKRRNQKYVNNVLSTPHEGHRLEDGLVDADGEPDIRGWEDLYSGKLFPEKGR